MKNSSASQLSQWVKNAGDDCIQAGSLGQEDPLEEKWQPTLIFVPGESHERRSLTGYSPSIGSQSVGPN